MLNGWRSLAPITHSISTKTYYNLEGDKTGFPLFDFTSDAAIQALMIMKQMLDLSSANALQPGSTDGGVNQTPDEIAFAAELVPYYIKYQNAPLRIAEKWKDPKQFRMGALPRGQGRRGRHGLLGHRRSAVQVRQEQGEGRRVPQGAHLRAADLEGLDRGQRFRPSGTVAAVQSIYADWQKAPPDWLTAQTWVPVVRAGLDNRQGHPESSVRPDAVPDRQAHLGEVPEGRRDGSQEGHAGSQGRRRGRDQEVRLLRYLSRLSERQTRGRGARRFAWQRRAGWPRT